MRKRNIVAVVGLTGALMAGGVASAGWLVSGFTPGDISTGNPQLMVQAGQQQSPAYPGGSVPTQITVTNPNSYPVDFGDVAFDSVTVDDQHPNCPANVLSVTFTNPHKMMLPSESDTFDVGVTMSPDAPQECVGATFHVVWRASAVVGTLS
jgi:hypothetical protein